MNKTTFLVLFAIILIACHKKNAEEICKQNVIEFIKSEMNNPSSFELVSFAIIDTVTYKQNIDYKISEMQENIKSDSTMISFYQSLEYGDYKEDIEKRTYEIEKNQKIIAKIQNISECLKDSIYNPAAYKVYVKFREKNAVNTLVINELIGYIDGGGNYEIIQLVSDDGKLFLTPNFPHEEEYNNFVMSLWEKPHQ